MQLRCSNCILFLCLIFFFQVDSYSQEVINQSFFSKKKNIEIHANSLDEIIIENSTDEEFRIVFYDENPNSHHLNIDKDSSVLKFFFTEGFLKEDQVFKKFITQRLTRASAKIYIPNGKNVSIVGDKIDVLSNSYKGNLFINIYKGLIELGDLHGNIEVQMFQGSLYAQMSNTSLDIISNKGKIEVNNILYSNSYKKSEETDYKKFIFKSINANSFITVSP